MDTYSSLVRPLLFRLSAEHAHELGRLPLRSGLACRVIGAGARVSDPSLATDLAGIALTNPVGLAPGLDKNGELLAGLQHLGFGYVVVGSITPLERKGNPKPRLVRYPETESIANSMGLPSKGLTKVLEILKQQHITGTKVLASIAGFTPGEIVDAVRAVEPYVAGTEVGLVCPNSSDSEKMEERQMFDELMGILGQNKTKPRFVKLPPAHNPEEFDRLRYMVKGCIDAGLDGVSINGGHTIEEPKIANGRGSIAGRQIFDESLHNVREVAQMAGGQLVIRASGGIFSGDDAQLMLDAGATTVEIYSAFIFRGWNAAANINRRLVQLRSANAGAPTAH